MSTYLSQDKLGRIVKQFTLVSKQLEISLEKPQIQFLELRIMDLHLMWYVIPTVSYKEIYAITAQKWDQ